MLYYYVLFKLSVCMGQSSNSSKSLKVLKMILCIKGAFFSPLRPRIFTGPDCVSFCLKFARWTPHWLMKMSKIILILTERHLMMTIILTKKIKDIFFVVLWRQHLLYTHHISWFWNLPKLKTIKTSSWKPFYLTVVLKLLYFTLGLYTVYSKDIITSKTGQTN